VRFSELEGQSVGVWGAGREIGSFARQLARRLPAARIVAAAFDSPPSAAERAALGPSDPRIVSAAESLGAMSGCALVVRSPGVSVYRPELVGLREAGVAVTTATALWLAERGGAGVIGITGTKGKSTTAALAFHIARAAGARVRLAGNIGVPALDLLDEQEAPELVVLELSSYQIADLQVGPEVALITNLFREHTDWHGSEEIYLADKLRLLGLPGVRAAVLNARDERLAALSPRLELHLYGQREGWDVAQDGLALSGRRMLASEELPLRGEHNALNLCGALSALEAIPIELPPLAPALADFAALPHRLQPALERGGVSWVDDSISTTPESSIAALASFPGPNVVLIAGGQDRGQDYTSLARALAASGAAVIGVPSTGPRLIAAALAAGVDPSKAREVPDLAAAVVLAAETAEPGGVVLLSPAAPSYDNYRDFEARGERFRELAERAAR
jgi:UDP-N-acetylmuramoyl-L-alanine---L-glutamate ligase